MHRLPFHFSTWSTCDCEVVVIEHLATLENKLLIREMTTFGLFEIFGTSPFSVQATLGTGSPKEEEHCQSHLYMIVHV